MWDQTGEKLSQPRSIESTAPFVSKAREYVEKGWGVVPLPEKRKEYPPTGFTGRSGKFAEEDDLLRWLSDPQYAKGNIALRVGNMLVLQGVRYEVIGIDVDNYADKKGGKELAALEKKLGELPPTWSSSSRDDGVSGIRFFLVPYGYGFRGKADNCIEIIQRVHRYAVIYPSVHPETDGQYYWYTPEFTPDGVNFSLEIPKCSDLSLLPDKWIDFLTDGRRDDNEGQYGIDLDISLDELKKWIKVNFNPPLPDEPGGMCTRMKFLVAQHIKEIEKSPSAHDKLTKAHWNLICEAAEGHSGLVEAIKEVESVWVKALRDKGKIVGNRNPKREVERSRWGTFRKVKAKADTFAAQGLSFFNAELCMSANALLPDKEGEDLKAGRDGGAQGDDGTDGSGGAGWINRIPLELRRFDPKDYDKNDVGQAKHFYDRVGDNVRYLADYNAWIIYDGITWHIDDFKLMRDLFDRACIRTSKKRRSGLIEKLERHIVGGGSDTDAIGAPLKKDISKLNWVIEHYGNMPKIKAALERAQSIPGVAMRYSELNWDSSVLAMPDGKVIKLDEPTGKGDPEARGFQIIENRKEFYTTQSTAVDFVKPQELSDREKSLWKGYLDLFLPDLEYRRFVQKALGHILFGGNPEKLAIFLVGSRNTGKTTMINAIQSALGDYAETFQPNAVFKDSGTGNNPELSNLMHKRGIFSSESGSQRIHANPLKRNTGGDKISTTRKFANSQIIGIPHFVPVVATNQSPTIDDADEALIKRIMVLPFVTQVDDTNNDRRADVTVPRDAKRAVFTWLAIGYRMYIREGLSYNNWHPNVIAATLEFASELSDVSTFLNDVCMVAPDTIKHDLNKMPGSIDALDVQEQYSKVKVSALYQIYLAEIGEGQKALSIRAFGKKVRNFFGVDVISKRSNGQVSKVYLGLKWKNEEIMNQMKV